METQTAFVRADSAVELNAVTEVSLNFTFIVYPSHTECEDTIGFYDTFNDFCFFEFWVLVVHLFN